MIPIELTYIRPDTLGELTQAAREREGEFEYYGGGSEIISMARVGSIAPKCVIDVKAVPELRAMALENGVLTLGAALTLTEIAEANYFPALTATITRIADHTNQCRITLGGNIAGTIAYREAVLPLLIADARITFLKEGKRASMPLMSAFDRRLKRAPNEMIVRFDVDEKYLNMPWAHIKYTRGDKIDYPVVTITALKAPDGLRFALSGVTGYPFRSPSLEHIMSDGSISAEKRADKIMRALPDPPITDILAGADWRAYQARRALKDVIEKLEERAI